MFKQPEPPLYALLTGFHYGGVLVLYAATVVGIWGHKHVGQVYGWLFSANIPAAMAPLDRRHGL